MRKFTPQAPLADIFVRESDWQKDDQMSVAHVDLYAQSWKTNFGPNPIENGPPDYTLNNDDVEYVPIEIPDNNHPPSLKFPEKGGGAQWSSPLKAKKKIMSKYHKKFVMMKQKFLKKTPNENTPELQTQKTPKNSGNAPLQEEPMNTRGEKFNLRPNPNPNYSDSYRC